MASSGKKKTTMAKLTRESRLRERRIDKKARKDARKLAATLGPEESLDVSIESDEEDLDQPDQEDRETVEGVAQT